MINSFSLLLKRSCAVGIVLFHIILLAPFIVQSQAVNNFVEENKSQASAQTFSAYLFVYFTGNDKKEEAIRFALSNDGYHFWALNGNKPVISSEQISSTGGVRDPHIL